MMKVLTCITPGTLEYSVGERPQHSTGNAIIKIKRIGICGTDLHAYEGTQPFFSYPRVLGHELAGELVAFDNAANFEIGEAVSFIPYFNCGNCVACRNGKPNCCTHMRVFGVHVNGGMAEYISVPCDSLLHGDGLSYDELALVEPLAIGAHGVRRAGVKPGEFVLVIGAGPIGLGTMEFARIAGAKVIALDINENRLQFCADKLKVTHTVNAASSNVTEQLMEITDGEMPTVVIDATGSLKAINNAFKYMAHGATYVLIGLQKGEVSFSHPEFHKREGTLMSSRNATREDFEHVIDSIKNGLVDPATYITHRVRFEQVKDEFEKWLDPANGVIKAIIEMD
jgi:2-desacetyl-2-hydroxyethyl bacteriochlorophyllide A dehydrogenase